MRAWVQERIRIPENKMDYYKDLAEMYVGDDVSPDFYGWVFPKYDHVAVGAPSSFLFICTFLFHLVHLAWHAQISTNISIGASGISVHIRLMDMHASIGMEIPFPQCAKLWILWK